jgi:L-arabinonolactonase
VWWGERRALLWTDIPGSRLWMHDAEGTTSWELPDRLGSLATCASGRLLLGLARGLFITDIDDLSEDGLLELAPLAGVEHDLPSTRINDGRTDRSGNFVFGTMNEEEGHAPLGSFYQWSTAAGLRRLDLPHVGIANSICFSPDGGTMYFCDSPRGRIMQCRYDADSAGVSGVREFVTLQPSEGQPDGSIIDADGCLWNAGWSAGVVRRYRQDGTLEREIAVPAKNPTCAVLGGTGLNELYITTARQEMTNEELQETPEAGGIYRAYIEDATGLPDALFQDDE